MPLGKAGKKRRLMKTSLQVFCRHHSLHCVLSTATKGLRSCYWHKDSGLCVDPSLLNHLLHVCSYWLRFKSYVRNQAPQTTSTPFLSFFTAKCLRTQNVIKGSMLMILKKQRSIVKVPQFVFTVFTWKEDDHECQITLQNRLYIKVGDPEFKMTSPVRASVV